MIFIDPSLEKVFNTLVDNDEIIKFLKDNDLLITKASLYDNYDVNQIKDMELSIYVNNTNTLYEVAQVLLNHSEEIKENQIWYLISNKVAWDELAGALGINPKEMDGEIYKNIMYTYKYCVVSSFFQNNKDKFIPENDFYEMQTNPAASAFYDAMMKEFDKLDVTIDKCLDYMDYDTIPYEHINYLTQLLGWEKSDINADETVEKQFRELAKNILDIYRIKGTNYSFELFFNFLGFDIKISEYYFDRRLYYTTNSAGNSETEESNNKNYEYYLTINNPIDNKLENIGASEIVKASDITPQYSLHEFNELCNKYGPEAVLGYSPIYPVYNSNGDLIEYKEYTGKVYKYFKTNVIYYTIKLEKTNPSEKQLAAVAKYLEFLTPSYVMRKIKVDTYQESTEEPIGFDGDGSGSPDAYGNYGSFTILDGEDWSQDFKDEYVKDLNGVNKQITNKYDGKEETYEIYTNSAGGNKYRLPLEHRSIAMSTSKYLTGGTGTNYPQARRLKYYILHTLNGEVTDSWGDQNVIVTPYYTVPPYIGNNSYVNMKTHWEKKTPIVNLTGGDGKGGEECVKTQIRDSDLRTPIDFVTDKTIDEFLNNDAEFNELYIGRTFSRTLSKVKEIPYGKGQYENAYEAYLWEFNQHGTHICNISCPLDAFNNEVTSNNGKETKDSINKQVFDNEIYTDAQIKEYYKNGILKDLSFGDYVVSYSGTLTNGKLIIYRYGYVSHPIKNDAEQYELTYLKYLNSFEYKIEKAYRGSLSNYENINLAVNYITKNTLLDVDEYVKSTRKEMIDIAINKKPEEWFDVDYITDKLFYVAADGEYYKAVKKPALSGISVLSYPNGRHIFSSMQLAEEYFENHPEEKINNAEFYIDSRASDGGLYIYSYKNRKKGTLVYSLADETLYYIYGPSNQDVKKLDNFYGNLSITRYSLDNNGDYYLGDNGLMYKDVSKKVTGKDRYSLDNNGDVVKCEINKYDYFWKGYDESADEEDFIFYNSSHTIDWKELGINNEKISRPVRFETDKHFEEDTSHLLDVYTEGKDPANFKLVSGIPTYYNTYGQKIISEISSKTVDNFTAKEHIDWYVEEQHARGLLSIIENNIKAMLGVELTNKFDYYSKVSDFIQDYYRIIVLGNTSKNSIPLNIAETFTGKKYENITDKDITPKFINDLRAAYNKSIIELAEELDGISKDRIYYHKIGNWRDMVSGNIFNWEALPEDRNYELIYKNPFDSSYGPKLKQSIGGKYYYSEKTAFYNTISASINRLKELYGDNVRFDIDNKLLGKDSYSLGDRHYDSKSDNVSYKYNYATYQGNSEITIPSNVNISYDSIYNFYIAYSLNYGLKNYSKDFYGEQRDIYSEFTEIFDLLHSFALGENNAAENIDNFLKTYYYKKLVCLYRETFIDDTSAVGIETYGKAPMKVYPKLAELYNGKAGTYSNPGTLLSTYSANGSKIDNTKLKFFKFSANHKDNYRTTVMKFYVKKEDFISCYGYDFNRYYKYLDLLSVSSQSQIDALSSAIEEMYNKQFASIRPHFYYYSDEQYKARNFKLTNWQKARNKLEIDFSEAEVDLVDDEFKSITTFAGRVVDKNGTRLSSKEEIKNRLKEASIIVITVTDKTVTPSLRIKDYNSSFFKDTSNLEEENIYGYLTVKKITQSFADNYISKSYYNNWINKNSEKEPTEYVSFGDDRTVDIKVTNKVINNDTYEKYFDGTVENGVHNETVAQFDAFNRVLTEDGYKQFDNTKTFEDQGLQPVYKQVDSNPIKINADGDIGAITKLNISGEEYVINSDEIKIFYNQYGELVVSVPDTKMTSGNINKIKIFFKLLYIYVKKIFFRSTAYINSIVSGGYNVHGYADAYSWFDFANIYILTKIGKIVFKAKAKLASLKDVNSGANVGKSSFKTLTSKIKFVFGTMYKVFGNLINTIGKIKDLNTISSEKIYLKKLNNIVKIISKVIASEKIVTKNIKGKNKLILKLFNGINVFVKNISVFVDKINIQYGMLVKLNSDKIKILQYFGDYIGAPVEMLYHIGAHVDSWFDIVYFGINNFSSEEAQDFGAVSNNVRFGLSLSNETDNIDFAGASVSISPSVVTKFNNKIKKIFNRSVVAAYNKDEIVSKSMFKKAKVENRSVVTAYNDGEIVFEPMFEKAEVETKTF